MKGNIVKGFVHLANNLWKVGGHGDAERECHQKLFHLSSSRPQRQLIFIRHPQESVKSHYPTFEIKPITELEQRLRRPDFVVARYLSVGDHLADPRHVHEVFVVEILGDGISAPGAAPERGGGGKPVCQ